MSNLLEKLKLAQNFEAELPLTAEEFRAQMNEKIDRENPGFFSDALDAWRSHKNQFKGQVEKDTLVFKHRQEFFSVLTSLPMAYVSFAPKGKYLEVKTKINAFKGPMRVIAVVVPLAIIAVAVSLLSTADYVTEWTLLIPIAIAFLLMIILPVAVMRLALSRLKKKITKHLYPIQTRINLYD